MSDEHTIPEKATIRLVYDLVDDLRREVNTQFAGLDQRFAELRTAIDSMRTDFVVREAWQTANEAIYAAIGAAVAASKDDRQKLWDAVHELEKHPVECAKNLDTKYASKLTERVVYGMVGASLLALLYGVLSLLNL